MIDFAALRAEITDVARVQHKVGPYRIPIALILSTISSFILGPIAALTWISGILICEVWTWFATKDISSDAMDQSQLINYLASGFCTVPCWTGIGILYWFHPANGSSEIAIVLWGVQLIYTQRFIYRSVLAIIIGNSSTVMAMLLLPIFAPKFDPMSQFMVIIGLLVAVGFAISGALLTMSTMRSLSDQTLALEHEATHDGLTGLYNRAYFQRMVAQLYDKRSACSVIFIDLDRFKQVNDTLGHQAGDELLSLFAHRLVSTIPKEAVACRYGGDEFAVLIPYAPPHDQQAALGHRIVEATSDPFDLISSEVEKSVQIGASVGIASAPEHADTPEELLRNADLALYAVKASGKSDFRIFDACVTHMEGDRSILETELRAALVEREGLFVFFQPRVDNQAEIKAVEGLLRWAHPVQGYISPIEIIQLAEKTGLIHKLGQWITVQCLQFATRWPHLRVSINVSPIQLQKRDFADWVQAQVDKYKIDPQRIELEVTESVLLDETNETVRNLEKLRNAGFQIAIDDFGTGYSSLKLLHRLPVDRIKIDQSFIQDHQNKFASEIIKAITKLSHAVEIQVTAEGVEQETQEQFLRATGVDEFQGFLYSPPVSESDLRELYPTRNDRIDFGAWESKDRRIIAAERL
nr:EAL domain-containing protein [Hyphomonas sp. Mor2]